MKNNLLKTLFDKLCEKKQSYAGYKRTRRLSMELLEDRELLSVTPADLQAIRAAYPDLNFSDNINIIEVAADQLTDNSEDAFNLRKALAVAAGTEETDDLIVVRTTDTANTIRLKTGEIRINANFKNKGDVTIVSLGEKPLTIDAGADVNNPSRVLNISSPIDVTLAGIAITGGYTGTTGGGIYFGGNTGDLNLINSSVTGNYSQGRGGGIYSTDGEGILTLINSDISGNRSEAHGGAIYCSGTFQRMNIRNSVFSNNAASNFGGGIFITDSNRSLSIINSVFSENTATNGGSIYYAASGALSIVQSTITENTASTGSGGGIYNVGYALTLNNTIIAGNTAFSDSDIVKGSSTTIRGNNNLIGNNNGLSNLFNEGTANIIGTPDNPIDAKFVDPANGDYRLNNGSPAINAGQNNSIGAISKDVEGKERIIGRYVDIGAYEFLEKPSVEVTTTLDIIDASDGLYSLREAIQYATEDNNVVTFHASLTGETILLNNQTDDYYQFYGELTLDKNVVIDGADKNITINADEKSRIFYVAEDANATLKNLKLTGGKTSDSGGAVFNEGNLTLINNLIFENAASFGGGIANAGTLAVTNNTIADNTASSGGGLFNDAGISTINNSIIAENSGSDIEIAPDRENAISSIVQGRNNISSFDAADWLFNGNYLYYSEKPLFADGSYEIAVGSLAIDRGNDALALDENGENIGFDVTGTTARRRGNGVDVGAYESPYYLPLAPILDVTDQTETTVSLAWNEQDADWDELNKVWYNIAYKKKGETEWTYYQSYNGTDDVTKYKNTSIDVDGLYPASAYAFRVEAENAHGIKASETEENAAVTKPTAEIHFSAETLTSNSADLIWDAQGEELTYEIYYIKSSQNDPDDDKENDLDIWTKYSPAPNVDDTAFTVNGLESSTHYDFKLVVANISGSAEAFIYEALTLPIAPTGLECIDVTETTVTLTWDDQTGEDFHYIVEYRTDDGEWKPVDDENDNVGGIGDGASYVVSGLDPSAEYGFRVIAENESGSATSNEATVITKPASPSNFQVENRTTNAVLLSWREQKNLNGYTLSYKKHSDGEDSWSEEIPLDFDATLAEVNGLESSVQYDFRLIAVNESGAAIVTATAWTYPALPAGFRMTEKTYQSVSLAWNDNSATSFYEVYYTTDEDYLSDAVWNYAGTTFDMLLNVSGLESLTTYAFRLVAYNANNDASAPVYVTVTTKVSPPITPSLEIDEITYQSVAIVWAEQENLDSYQLEYKTSASDWNAAIFVTLDADAKSYIAIDLIASTDYQFRLTAKNESGGATSDVLAVTTFDRPSLIVTTLNDIVDPFDGLVSLREAISWATPASHVIFFDPGLFVNGSQAIILQSELLITSATTLNAPGATLLTLDANQSGRHLTICANEQDVIINGLTFANGKINKNGGSIYLDGGNLVLTGVTFRNNAAVNKFGGALYQKAGTVAMIGVTFDRNKSKNGGAYFQMSGESTLTASTFINNSADYGGAFYIYGGVSEILESYWGQTQFFGNTGKWGGAIYQNGGDLKLEYAWLNFNTATWGGAILQNNGNLTAQNTSFQYNTATWGGGFYLGGGTTNLLDVKFTENTVSRKFGSAIAKIIGSKLTIKKGDLEKTYDEALEQYLDETIF
ncbi:MAG: fibronectin type III domain-containing protein [Planctomycetaceae bacterium]|jgi:predicted outer membrane repeat protein|nr:fibronectin type III domain-containing protein [Planctomycetaceae bacterium]